MAAERGDVFGQTSGHDQRCRAAQFFFDALGDASSSTAVPSTEPDSIQLSVFTPMALFGEPRRTCGSWAQRSPKARSPVDRPGR